MNEDQLFRLSPFAPLRNRSTIAEISDTEQIVRIEGAKTIYLNRQAILQDFFGLSGAEKNRAIDTVLRDFFAQECAIMSETQMAHFGGQQVRSIPGGTAYRPPRYGRALVIDRTHSDRLADLRGLLGMGTVAPLLLDIKGCGVAPGAVPQPLAHKTGLFSLSEAVEETALQAIVDAALASTLPQVYTLPIYAIIQLPFTTNRDDEGTHLATLLVRRAHARPAQNNEIPSFLSKEYLFKLEVECALRRCGVTSAGGARFRLEQHGGGYRAQRGTSQIDTSDTAQVAAFVDTMNLTLPFVADQINVQCTDGPSTAPIAGELLDFGHYEARPKFTTPFLATARDFHFMCGGILYPDAPEWMQPDATLAFDGAYFMRNIEGAHQYLSCPTSGAKIGPISAFKSDVVSYGFAALCNPAAHKRPGNFAQNITKIIGRASRLN